MYATDHPQPRPRLDRHLIGTRAPASSSPPVGTSCQSSSSFPVNSPDGRISPGQTASLLLGFLTLFCCGLGLRPVLAQTVAPPVEDQLVVHLRSDAGVVTDVNGRVEIWEDQSVADGINDAVQTLSFARPLLIDPAVGDVPVLRFDGVNDALILGASPTLESDRFTWFVVCRINQIPPGTQSGVNDVGSLLSSSYADGAGALSNRMWGSFVNLNGVLGSFARQQAGPAVTSFTDASEGFFFMLSGVWDDQDQVQQTVDGEPSPVALGADATPVQHLETQIGALENSQGILTRFLDGDIAEVLIYTTDLSDREIGSVIEFLFDKYVPQGFFFPVNVVVTSPGPGEMLRDDVVIDATAEAATEVEFFVSGVSVGIDTEAPYSVIFDSNAFPDGPAEISVEARNGSSNTLSDPVSVTIDNAPPKDDSIPFIRGDVDGNGIVQPFLDALYLFAFGYVPGSPAPVCLDAADVDDNGSVHPLADGFFLLIPSFLPFPPPTPAPFPDCGLDPTQDVLECETETCP